MDSQPKEGRWSEQRLAHVMREVQRPIDVEAQGIYREIGIRSHGRGIFHKDHIRGFDLGEKRVFALEPGDFIFNIVFAWEAAVAIAGDEERGFIGSHRFPTFRLAEDRIDPRFLYWFFSNGYGLFLLGEHSPGSAGRNRTLDRAKLLKEKVWLPPVEEQRAIARLLDRTTAAIDVLISRKNQLVALLTEKRHALITNAVTGGSEGEPMDTSTASGILGSAMRPSTG